MESPADRERKYQYILKQSEMSSAFRRKPVYLDYNRDGTPKQTKGGGNIDKGAVGKLYKHESRD